MLQLCYKQPKNYKYQDEDVKKVLLKVIDIFNNTFCGT